MFELKTRTMFAVTSHCYHKRVSSDWADAGVVRIVVGILYVCMYVLSRLGPTGRASVGPSDYAGIYTGATHLGVMRLFLTDAEEVYCRDVT